MAQPDEMIEVLFVNITRIPLEDIKKILGEGPKEAKMNVAFEIVKKFYGEKKATVAKNEWISVFSKKEGPQSAPELKLKKKNISIIDLLIESGIKSKSEARRLIAQNAISINNEVKKDPDEVVSLKGGEILKVGKKNFFKIT
jgi:tyrosyl-tRNA synthetase